MVRSGLHNALAHTSSTPSTATNAKLALSWYLGARSVCIRLRPIALNPWSTSTLAASKANSRGYHVSREIMWMLCVMKIKKVRRKDWYGVPTRSRDVSTAMKNVLTKGSKSAVKNVNQDFIWRQSMITLRQCASAVQTLTLIAKVATQIAVWNASPGSQYCLVLISAWNASWTLGARIESRSNKSEAKMIRHKCMILS